MLNKIFLSLGGIAALAALVMLDSWNKLWALLIFPAVAIGLILAHFIVMFAAAMFVSTKELPKKTRPFFWFMLTEAIDMIIMVLRVRLHVKGDEQVPLDRRFLFVCNHRSMLDPVFAIGTFRRQKLVFISKPEVMRAPFLGQLLYACGCSPIDRENPRNALTCINHNAELIKSDACSVGVYPEGTRSKDGRLLPFHDGVFKIAQKACVPVVVATVEGSELVKKNYPWRSTDVYLTVHKVIDNSPEMGLKSRVLADDARSVICAALGEDQG